MTYHEEGMIGAGTDDPDLDSVLGIPLDNVSKGRERARMQLTPAKPSKT